MAEKNPARIELLVDHIAVYLSENPHAADSATGIQSWWLSGITSGLSDGDVERAIGILLERGALELRILPDGTRVYASARAAANSALD